MYYADFAPSCNSFYFFFHFDIFLGSGKNSLDELSNELLETPKCYLDIWLKNPDAKNQ